MEFIGSPKIGCLVPLWLVPLIPQIHRWRPLVLLLLNFAVYWVMFSGRSWQTLKWLRRCTRYFCRQDDLKPGEALLFKMKDQSTAL